MEKIKSDDEGQIKIAVFVKDGHLIIDFGNPVSWLGLHKEEVVDLIILLKSKLAEL